MLIYTINGDVHQRNFGDSVRGMRAKCIQLTEWELRNTKYTKEECLDYIHYQLKVVSEKIIYTPSEDQLSEGNLAKSMWPGVNKWYKSMY